MTNWKEIVRNIAPALGSAHAGPMASTATHFIAQKFLEKADATEAEIEQAIVTASPEQLSKLKNIDEQFKEQMKQLNINVYDLEYRDMGRDRESARKLLEINVWPQIILSAVFICGYFVVLALLLTNEESLPSNNSALLGVFTTILGVLTAAVPQILNFWFGSSLGSKEKTRSMHLTSSQQNIK